ncbi:MAG: hypothetical protein DWQ04_10505 [Chloroflexi bacterium]|nr:MAG: hypothetical protein DWQ04_10505 [Chloroflexota bacterium]
MFTIQQLTEYFQEDVTVALSVEERDANIPYVIGIDHQETEAIARIEYDSSATGIEKYRKFNDAELAKILQRTNKLEHIPGKIIFKIPLSQEDYTAFVEQYNIDVDTFIF